jgi:hypothetical protein
MMPHPHVRARRALGDGEPIRAVVFAPAPPLAAWLEDELPRCPSSWRRCDTVEQIVERLIDDPPPRPLLLIADFDAMAPAGVLHLHAIRERGWFGVVIGFGAVPRALRSSLRIHRVVAPHRHGALADAIVRIGFTMATTRIARLP